MKSLIALSLTVLSLAGLADNIDAAAATKSEKFRLLMNKRTGGMLVRPDSQRGTIVYANCQDAVSKELIDENIAAFSELTHYKIEYREGTFEFPNIKLLGDATLFIVNDATLPAVLSAPESKWAMVNVRNLKNGLGAKEAFLRARVQKELTRGFALLAGAQSSNYPNSIMGPVRNEKDLDQFPDWRLAVDVVARFKPYLSAFGIAPAEEATYRRACQEGWAPAPTNEYQKAIWNQTHEIPTEPLKIEYKK